MPIPVKKGGTPGKKNYRKLFVYIIIIIVYMHIWYNFILYGITTCYIIIIHLDHFEYFEGFPKPTFLC